MKVKALILAFCLSLSGCAGLLKGVRTVIDLATCLCEIVAVEQPQDKLGGLTPKEYCEKEENLRPFIEQITKAKAAAAQKAGFNRERN